MAEQLYFSRDTRMFIQFRNTTDETQNAADLGKGAMWEIPILDGYSFSQTTNTSEITLAEMESSAGISRRGRRMFTDSLAPAEWSFSTYVRPFKSLGQSNVASGVKAADTSSNDGVHAVEEVLWAAMFGADKYSAVSNINHFRRNVNPISGSETDVINASFDPNSTGDIKQSKITIQESNRSAMHAFTIWFLIDTDTTNPLLYRLPEAVVNEVGIDFDVDGIATLNWSGFAKEVQDKTSRVLVTTDLTPTVNNAHGTGDNLLLGDIMIDSTSRAAHLVSSATGGSTGVGTQAIDEAITSTSNFIRNRLTSVSIETATATDKVSGTFPGNHRTITAVSNANNSVFTVGANHNFSVGDVVYISGTCGQTISSVDMCDTKTGTITAVASTTVTTNIDNSGTVSGSFSGTPVMSNGKYSLTLTGGSFTIGNNITYLLPEELGAINKPLEHVTGTRTATGNATCYITLDDTASVGTQSGTSRQFFNDLVGTGAMGKVVNKFKVTMAIGGAAATGTNITDPALEIIFPTAHIEVPTHAVEDVLSLETNFTALPTDFGTADEITSVIYFPPSTY